MNNHSIMSVTDDKPELGVSDKKEAPLSREVRRRIERIELNAQKTVMAMGEKFQSFLVESDVNEELINDKIAMMDKQWRFYCRVNHLTEKALPVVQKHLEAILNEFNKPL